MIISKDNCKIRLTRRLMTDKKTRKETGQFVIEGVRLVKEALASDRCEVQFILLSQDSGADIEGERVKESVFKTIADTVSSQGVVAVCRLNQSGKSGYDSNCLILDRIRDPGNMGAIIRTAAAAGYGKLYCIDCVDFLEPKAIRASMGGALYTDIVRADYEIVDILKNNGVVIIAADTGGNNVFEAELESEVIKCICIGSEADGLDKGILDKADRVVSIPMKHIESLNAAVSAGILMYKLR